MKDLLGGQVDDIKERLNQAQFAERVGCTPPYINKLKEKGVIKVGPDGKIDLEEGLLAIEEYTKLARSEKLKKAQKERVAKSSQDDEPEEDGCFLSVAESERRRKHFNAKVAELEYLEKKGELVPAEKVRRDAFAMARRTRDAMLLIPTRLMALLAVEDDAQRVRELLDAEIRKALEGLTIEGEDDAGTA